MIQPAVEEAVRRKREYPYAVPTLAVRRPDDLDCGSWLVLPLSRSTDIATDGGAERPTPG